MGSAFATCPIIAPLLLEYYLYVHLQYLHKAERSHTLTVLQPTKEVILYTNTTYTKIVLAFPHAIKIARFWCFSLFRAVAPSRATPPSPRAHGGCCCVVCTHYYTTAFFQLLLMTVQVCSVFWLCCCCTDDPTECPAQTGIILVVVNFYLGSNQ